MAGRFIDQTSVLTNVLSSNLMFYRILNVYNQEVRLRDAIKIDFPFYSGSQLEQGGFEAR